jgi:hypothetical protein
MFEISRLQNYKKTGVRNSLILIGLRAGVDRYYGVRGASVCRERKKEKDNAEAQRTLSLRKKFVVKFREVSPWCYRID